jgi:hypothetical protein
VAADEGLSPHPADRLIRELLRSGRPATTEEVNRIIQWMAVAPFPTATAHRQRHTDDEQWAEGVTAEQYIDDLRRAIGDPNARLAIYVRRGGHMAAVLTDTDRVVAAARRGPDSVPLLFVAHSADRGIIVTGYQASRLDRIRLPEDVRWLR